MHAQFDETGVVKIDICQQIENSKLHSYRISKALLTKKFLKKKMIWVYTYLCIDCKGKLEIYAITTPDLLRFISFYAHYLPQKKHLDLLIFV